MSYTIFYRAMFIKMSNGEYIPLIESGDNNVWDVDRNRRSRKWASCRWLKESEAQRRRFSLTEEEILDIARKEIRSTVEEYNGKEPPFGGTPYTEKQILENLGDFNTIKVYGRKTTSATNFFNFIKSGIRNATTFKELSCGLRLSWYELSEDKSSSSYCTDYAKDEEELARKWKQFQNRDITPWIELSEASADYAWERIKKRTRRPHTERKEPKELFVITFNYRGGQYYMTQLTTRNIKFSSFDNSAYKYTSCKLAENAAKKICQRFSQFNDIRVKKYPH